LSAYLVLNTDASLPDPSGKAAIGVVLRQRKRANGRLEVIDYISKTIGPVPIQVAEYRALIEGLKLARRYDPSDLHVFADSASVVKQVTTEAPKFHSSDMRPLHAEARKLIDHFEERITISWIPRDMNAAADQRAADAFLRPRAKGQ
jgi:ribonuclease HI